MLKKKKVRGTFSPVNCGLLRWVVVRRGTRSSVMLVLYEYEGVDLYALCLANIWCRQMGILRKAAAVVVCKRLAEQDCSAALLLPSPANFSFPSFPFTSFEVKSH